MKLYLHRAGQTEPALVEVDESIAITELIKEHGEEGHSAWLEDGDELVIERTVVEVVNERAHIYIGRCREVAVRVRYGGPEGKAHGFKPSATIKTVFDWAVGPEAFNLPAAERTTHDLFVPGSQTPLDSAEHIGVIATDCQLLLDLAAKHRHQG